MAYIRGGGGNNYPIFKLKKDTIRVTLGVSSGNTGTPCVVYYNGEAIYNSNLPASGSVTILNKSEGTYATEGAYKLIGTATSHSLSSSSGFVAISINLNNFSLLNIEKIKGNTYDSGTFYIK